MIDTFIEQHKLPAQFKSVAQKWYHPLCEQIISLISSHKKPLIMGINGCQGSGKSTMVDFIANSLQQSHQLNVVCLSLDDFYYDQKKRSELAEVFHPLLSTRGVPGTHDTQLLTRVLNDLIQGKATHIPRFNKATDNPLPQQEWTLVTEAVDVILMEGWCWGVKPQAAIDLPAPVNDLEKLRDQSYVWREYVNQQLASHYLPLYDLMDKWLMLKAPSFEQVLNWRWQQEQKLIEQSTDQDQSAVMTKHQITHFISYFQRLTEHALNTLPQECDLVFELDTNRQINQQVGTI